MDADIQPVEAITWSWHTAARRGSILALAVLAINLLVKPPHWPYQPADLLTYLPNALLAIVGWLPVCGFRRGTLSLKTRTNHGVWLSLRNALLAGGLTFATAAMTVYIGRWIGGWIPLQPGPILQAPGARLDASLPFLLGLLLGSLAALWFGGTEVVKHLTVRALLALEGQTPWRYPRFLEYASRASLLKRTGGSYMFLHRSLQDLLATWRG